MAFSRFSKLLAVALCLIHFISGCYSATFTITNKCSNTIWPGILSNAGTSQLSTTGFVHVTARGVERDRRPSFVVGSSVGADFLLKRRDHGEVYLCNGRLWLRHSNECAGGGAAPPASLAEFTLNGANGLDFYDVSLVDGYNLPMLVVPQGGTGGNCTTTGCVVDLNAGCPSELKVTTDRRVTAAWRVKARARRLGIPCIAVVELTRHLTLAHPARILSSLKMRAQKLTATPMTTAPAPSLVPPPTTSSLSALLPPPGVKSANGQFPVAAGDVSASSRRSIPNVVVFATVLAAVWRLLPPLF